MENIKICFFTKDDEILRTKCKEVDNVDKNIIDTLNEMLSIMYKNNGIGLAANQIGLTKRMVVIDMQENNIKKPLFLINPRIVKHSNEFSYEEEGCLSIPNQKAKVKRYTSVDVEYINIEGKKDSIIGATGYFAICIQHELDHLDGILYVDHLSKLKKDFIKNKVSHYLNKLSN